MVDGIDRSARRRPAVRAARHRVRGQGGADHPAGPGRRWSSGSAATSRTLTPGLALLVPFIDRIRARIDLREQVVSLPAAAGDHLGQPDRRHRHGRLLPGDRPPGGGLRDRRTTSRRRADDHHHAAQRRRRDEPGADADQPRRRSTTSCAACSTRPPGAGGSGWPGWRSRPSTRRRRSRTRWRSRCAPTARSARSSSPPRGSGSRRSRPRRARRQSQILTAEGRKQAAILEAEAERQSRILRAEGERAARYLQAQGQAKAIEKAFAAIKAASPTPELLAYQYLQTLPQMAKGDANKMWIVPSDFGKALEGFTRCSARRATTGCSASSPRRSRTAPVNRPEDDDDAVRDWFDTAPDPALARAVAEAEQQARRAGATAGGRRGRRRCRPQAPRPRIAPPAPQGLPAGAPPQHQPAQHQPAAQRGPSRRSHQPVESPAGRVPAGRARAAQPRPAQPRPAAGQEGGPIPDESESAVPTPPRGIPQAPLDDPHATHRATPARGVPQADPVSRAGQSRPEGGRGTGGTRRPRAPATRHPLRVGALHGSTDPRGGSSGQGEPERQLQAVAGQQRGVGEQRAAWGRPRPRRRRRGSRCAGTAAGRRAGRG